MTPPAPADPRATPPAPPGDAPSPRARAGWPLRLALVLLPLPLLLGLSELVLLTLGLGGEPAGQVALRGFDPDSALLVPDDSAPGAWRTNLGLGAEFVVPPKGERRRVLLLGGSNTQAFSEGFLADKLQAAEPDGWEVFNLGRAGYGSRRVATLLEQALALEPDVVVLYSGHNEFVERVFGLELQAVWGEDGAWQAALADRLSGLRTFTVLVDALSPSEAAPAPGQPRDLQRTPPAGRQIPWAETRRYHAAYRHHMESMLELCRAAGVQVVLCTPLGNPLTPPISSTWDAAVDQDLRARFEALRGQAQSHMPPETRTAFHPPVRLRPPDWTAHRPPRSEAPGVTLRPLPDDLGAFLQAGTKGWPPATGWSDAVLTVLRTVERYVDPRLDAEERARLERARAWMEEAVALGPEQPIGWFDLGLVCLLLGDVPAARDAFTQARAWDRSPGAVSVHTNTILRELAAAHPEVTFLDSEAWFTERSPDGLVGYELLMDACHLLPGARTAFLRLLSETLLAMPRG